MKIEYWTQSTCCSCGKDGVLLTYARMSDIKPQVHIVTVQPDDLVERAKAAGFPLPFFTDSTHEHFWRLPKDIHNGA